MKRWPRHVATLAILAVAGVAGWISYTHITDLSLALHQPRSIASVMAFAVDGLITVGSVILLQGGTLGWLCVGPGVIISLYANVESGIQYGVRASIWAGIPAISFFLATFVLERWVTSQAHSPDSEHVNVLDSLDVLLDSLEARAVLAEAERVVRAAEHTLCVARHVYEHKPKSKASTPKARTPRPSTPKARTLVTPDEHVLQALKDEFEHELKHGLDISVRAIKDRMHVGTPKAQDYLKLVTA